MKLLPVAVEPFKSGRYVVKDVSSDESELFQELLASDSSNSLRWREVSFLRPYEMHKHKSYLGQGMACHSASVQYALQHDARYVLKYTAFGRLSAGNSYMQYDLLVPLPSRHKHKLEQLFEEEGKQVNVETREVKNFIFGPPKELKRPKVHEYWFMQALHKNAVLPVFDHVMAKFPFDFREMVVHTKGTRKNLHDASGMVEKFEQKTLHDHKLYVIKPFEQWEE